MDPEAAGAMERNDEASEAFRDVFGNPIILNRILDQLPNSQLLELSLVSKLWKKKARIVMKKRGNVMALLNCSGYSGCGNFKAFGANLETFNEVIYSGITIRLNSSLDGEEIGIRETEAIHESILAGMRGKLKRLSIRLEYPGVCDVWHCPFIVLLRLLLRDFIGELEHLTLRIDSITVPFIPELLPPGPYPKLKVLKLRDACRVLKEKTFGNQIRMLLSRAPNLQEIHTYGRVSLKENLMEGREGVVHVHESFFYTDMQDISENVAPALRLKRMGFFYNTGPELELDKFNGKARSILRSCATTLEVLHLGDTAAVLLMSYGIQLVNVKDLYLKLDYVELEQFEPRILSILSRMDFTYFFPNLKKVRITTIDIFQLMFEFQKISRDWDTMDAIIEQASAVQMEPTLPRAGNIKELCFDQRTIPRSAFQFFAQMFPAIEELHVKDRDQDFPVESVFELWSDLKWIIVDGARYQQRS